MCPSFGVSRDVWSDSEASWWLFSLLAMSHPGTAISRPSLNSLPRRHNRIQRDELEHAAYSSLEAQHTWEPHQGQLCCLCGFFPGSAGRYIPWHMMIPRFSHLCNPPMGYRFVSFPFATLSFFSFSLVSFEVTLHYIQRNTSHASSSRVLWMSTVPLCYALRAISWLRRRRK